MLARSGRRRRAALRLTDRQADGEAGATSRSLVGLDRAAMLGGDASAQRQADAGARPRGLVVKNGSKIRCAQLGRDAGAVVGDLDPRRRPAPPPR